MWLQTKWPRGSLSIARPVICPQTLSRRLCGSDKLAHLWQRSCHWAWQRIHTGQSISFRSCCVFWSLILFHWPQMKWPLPSSARDLNSLQPHKTFQFVTHNTVYYMLWFLNKLVHYTHFFSLCDTICISIKSDTKGRSLSSLLSLCVTVWVQEETNAWNITDWWLSDSNLCLWQPDYSSVCLWTVSRCL